MFTLIFTVLSFITPAPAPVDLDSLQGSNPDQDEWSETSGGACKPY